MKRVVVTGGNKGIGLATCARLLKTNPNCYVLMGSRDEARGQSAVKYLLDTIPGSEGRIQMLALDVTSPESCKKAAAFVADSFGKDPAPLYGLINNAGVAGSPMKETLSVNVFGAKSATDAFLPLLDPSEGRIVNIGSAAGPNFVEKCTSERQSFFTNKEVTWDDINALCQQVLDLTANTDDAALTALGMDPSDPLWFPYGLSKACLHSYTMYLAKAHPKLKINACSPGFIKTDLTRPIAAKAGKQPEEMGMKEPEAGAVAPAHLMLDAGVESSGWYYGSDCQRSPLDRYRSPGDPPYVE